MGHRRDRIAKRLEWLTGKLPLSRAKGQNGESDTHSISSSRKHDIETSCNGSVIDDGISAGVLVNSNQGSQTQEVIASANNTPPSCQAETSPVIQPVNTPIRELWNLAYEKLREEDGALIAAYERELQGNIAVGVSSTIGSKASIRDRMQLLLKNKMEEVNQNVWKLTFGTSEVELKELVQPVLGVVNLANEYITGAVRANPYTSIAWAGVSLLLPLFLNPSSQNASLAKGLAFISSLISQSQMREELYIRRYESHTEKLYSFQQSHREYKNGLERLYKQILKFQATSYCYYASNTASRLGSDMLKWNDWDKLVDEIREQETAFANLTTIWRDIRYDEEYSATESRHKETANIWLAVGNDVSGLRKAVEDAQKETSRKELLKWLCSIDHTEIYNGARNRHEAGTSNWLLEDRKFKTWEKSLKSFLWLHGKAGSGKSILSSSVIKHLQDRYERNSSATVAYFYFSFSDLQKQKVDGMLSSLIKQISASRPNLPLAVQRLGDYKNGGGRPDIKTLETALLASVHGFSTVYIIIDALDECPVLGDGRKDLLNSLRRILEAAPDNIHVLCTSRKELDIHKAINPILRQPLRVELDLSIEREAVDRDISQYIDSILATSDYDSWPTDIKEESKRSLIEKADGMFQYVRCQFENLEKLSSVKDVRNALKTLPDGLDATYDRILQRIDGRFKQQVIRSLKWLCFSISPLDTDELAEIFVLPPDTDDALDKIERLFSSEDVLKYFVGLLVTDSTTQLVGTRSVRLAHFSIKEYLTSDRISQSPATTFSLTEIEAHMSIMRSCLSYHLHVCSITGTRDTEEYQLEYYASRNWAEHLEMIPRASWPPEILRDVMLSVAPHSQSLLHMIYAHGRQECGKQQLLHPHCYTARRGFYQLTEMLTSWGTIANKYQTQWDLDMGLQEALIGGNMKIVKLFLDLGADMNVGTKECALQIAVRMGHEPITELLLNRGAEINARRDQDDSALELAARGKHIGVLKVLLSRGAKITQSLLASVFFNEYGTLTTDEQRSLECLRILLDHGADVNVRDGDKLETALWGAACLEDDRAFNLLLERGANVSGSLIPTAVLRILRYRGKFERIKRLLDLGADPNTPGALQALYRKGSGKEMCLFARKNDEEVKARTEVIELLIERGADVNIMHDSYGTPLHAAASNLGSMIGIMTPLLESGADVNTQGGDYGNALQAACQSSDYRFYNIDYKVRSRFRRQAQDKAQLLLDHGADVHGRGGKYETALQAACAEGNEDLARLLIERGADVNILGGKYGTALQAACAFTPTTDIICTKLVRLLLENGADVHGRGGKYETALQAACAEGKEDLARLLIEHGADVNILGGKYGTALQAACSSRVYHPDLVGERTKLVRLLLENSADVNAEGGIFGTALQAVCSTYSDSEDTEIVRLLLDHGADIRLQNSGAWHKAAGVHFRRSKAILELLLDQGVDINDINGPHGTALNAVLLLMPELLYYDDLTAKIDRLCLLLNRGADVNLAAGKYGTALHTACAAEHHHLLMDNNVVISAWAKGMKILLESCPDIDVNKQSGIFSSALQAAAYSGQTESIRVLLEKGALVNTRGGKYGSALNAAIVGGFWDIVQILLDAGATPDCHELPEPDEEWLQSVHEEHGRGAVERYRKFWEVEKVEKEEREKIALDVSPSS